MRYRSSLGAIGGWLALVSLACSPGMPRSEAGGEEPSEDEIAPISARAAEAVVERVEYTLLTESISDTALKTQIEQHIVAEGIPSPEELAEELRQRYSNAKARRGFRHHNPASNVYIYVYGSEEQARASRGLWIGMVAHGPADSGKPEVQISEMRLAALSARPEERFGLSEQTRQVVFREIAAAEERAMHEAMERVPSSRPMEQIELERRLAAEYMQALANERNLSREQLRDIGLEGVKKGWP